VTGPPIDAAVLLEVGLAALAAAAAAMVAQAAVRRPCAASSPCGAGQWGAGWRWRWPRRRARSWPRTTSDRRRIFVTTGYGRIVLGEAALLAGAAGLWLLNHRYNLPLAERTLTSVRRVSWLAAPAGRCGGGDGGAAGRRHPPVGSAWAGRVDGGLTLMGSDPARRPPPRSGSIPGSPVSTPSPCD